MTRIQAVSFDFADTLATPRRSMEEILREALSAAGLTVDRPLRPPAWAVRRSAFDAAVSGAEGWREQFTQLWRDQLGLAPSERLRDAVSSAIQSFQDPRNWQMREGALSLLRSVSEIGVPAVILSNWGGSLTPVLQALGCSQLVVGGLTSSEIGAAKPQRRAFYAACELAGVSPGGTLHVGDDPVSDVRGARRAGLLALLVSTSAPLPLKLPR
ncbi:MAG: HAD-IA family hydrolase [Phycisphaerales bacterium]|nr:HAD-IA family hydrolase [Hyphomonadaceae bacterium]